MPPPARPLPRRILVPIPVDEASWDALTLAASMAKALRAEIRGLFVEDLDALAAASLPFTRVIAFQSGRLGALEVTQVEAAFRAQASRARQRLGAFCERQAVAWSFEVANRQALTAVEPEEAADTNDAGRAAPARGLLLLDRRALRPARQATALLRLAQSHSDAVAIWDTMARSPMQVVLVYRGDSANLELAAHLAQAMDIPLRILVNEASPDATANLVHGAREWLDTHRVHATLQELAKTDPARFRQSLASLERALIVIERVDLMTILADAAATTG